MRERRIARIVEVSGSLFVGIAEGLKWYVAPSELSSKTLSPGHFVWCYVLNSETDRTFFEEDPVSEFARYEDWLEQEKQFL